MTNVGVPNAASSRASDCFLASFDQGLSANGSDTTWTIMTASGTISHDAEQSPYAKFIDIVYTGVNDYDWVFNKAGFYKGVLSMSVAASTFVTGGNRAFQMGVNRAADNAKCPITTMRWLAADQIEDVHLNFAGFFKKGDALAPGTLFDTGSDVYASIDATLTIEYYREN